MSISNLMSMNLTILLTIIIFMFAKHYLHPRKKILLFSPLIFSPIVIIFVLYAFGLSFDYYDSGNRILTGILQPGVVALAIPVYKYWDVLCKNITEIAVGVIVGAIVGMVSAIVYSQTLHLSREAILSMAPHSVTTPIGVGLCPITGGSPTLTALFIVVTGLFGNIVGPTVLQTLGIKSKIALGLGMGTASHVIGTAKAFELGQMEGSISTLAMVFCGISTVILIPFVMPLMGLK